VIEEEVYLVSVSISDLHVSKSTEDYSQNNYSNKAATKATCCAVEDNIIVNGNEQQDQGISVVRTKICIS
jgi:hypothetical protein